MAMAEELSIAESFAVDLQWPANPGKGGDSLLDGSLARFQILVGGKSITAYQTEKGDKHSYLHVPTYYLVEWLAQNWWSFLYEPRKNDREDFEQDFRSRHWLGAPRSGIALPDVTFSPAGDKVEIVARSAFLRFAQLNFIEALTATATTDSVRSEFSKFIDQVLAHLTESGVKDSAAHQHWDRVSKTTKEEEVYCRMVGSLGLSPYVSHPEVDQVFEKVTGKITESMLTDLCDATNKGNFERAADVASGVSAALASAKTIQVKKLLEGKRPLDSAPRAYEWGYQATDVARSALGIAHDDPHGSASFFERLQLDPSALMEEAKGSEAAAPSLISGAVEREDDNMRIALTGSNRAHRKFAAARATFLAWSQRKKSSRLVTTARTRDQQASRAFAAELLAPAKFLKKRLGERSEVSSFTLDRVSEEMGIAPTVVHYQAKNHGYYIAEAA
jgi:hypothetical protein